MSRTEILNELTCIEERLKRLRDRAYVDSVGGLIADAGELVRDARRLERWFRDMDGSQAIEALANKLFDEIVVLTGEARTMGPAWWVFAKQRYDLACELSAIAQSLRDEAQKPSVYLARRQPYPFEQGFVAEYDSDGHPTPEAWNTLRHRATELKVNWVNEDPYPALKDRVAKAEKEFALTGKIKEDAGWIVNEVRKADGTWIPCGKYYKKLTVDTADEILNGFSGFRATRWGTPPAPPPNERIKKGA